MGFRVLSTPTEAVSAAHIAYEAGTALQTAAEHRCPARSLHCILSVGEEIARHIAREAREVLHSARTFTGPGTARQQQHTCTAPNQTDPHAPRHSGSVPQQEQEHSRSRQSCAAQQQKQEQQQQHELQQQELRQQQQQQGCIPPAPEPRPNITRAPMLQQLLPDGSAVLTGGQVVGGLDAVVYCTGYKYSLPWMEHLQLLTTGV